MISKSAYLSILLPIHSVGVVYFSGGEFQDFTGRSGLFVWVRLHLVEFRGQQIARLLRTRRNV